MTFEKLTALADRIKKSSGISIAEQYVEPGPLWFIPLGDEDQAAIVYALNAASEQLLSKERSRL